MRCGALAVGEVGFQQRFLQRLLFVEAKCSGPVQQTVRVKGVVDAAAPAAGLAGRCKLESKLCTALANIFAVGIGLLNADAVFLRDVFSNFLAFGSHVGV